MRSLRAARISSPAVFLGVIVQYIAFYSAGVPLWTQTIAEWIMARMPSRYSVLILESLGAWAKPAAMTGGLAALGAAAFLIALLPVSGWIPAAAVSAVAMGWFFEYPSGAGQFLFWLPSLFAMYVLSREPQPESPARRHFLAVVMPAATLAVALESYYRDQSLAKRATTPVDLFPFHIPGERAAFGRGLPRKAVTPVGEFYGMSKNAVDPAIDPASWRLRITVDGRLLRELRYSELLSLPRRERYVTLRCISNTLKSDLMGTAYWSGIFLSQLVDRAALPASIVEAAFLGIDGHGDSLTLDYAFSERALLALGMNGQTLSRTHGFPVRLLCPRYYGFKNVKWLSEIALLTQPYYGTWPKLGYTKEPKVHIASHIDRVSTADGVIRAGGVSFAGDRGIRAVQLRADGGPWIGATLEAPLSGETWTRWYAELPAGSRELEARAQDGEGRWQESQEGPLFPDGVTGPTIRRIG